MKVRWFSVLAVFILILGLHYCINSWNYSHTINKWAEISKVWYLGIYFRQQEYFIGLSYALAGGFTVFSLFRFFENRKNGAAGMLGGTAIMAIIYWAGCFLIGCCGSPMLSVYLSLFGSSFLGFTKPIIFTVTFLSIIVSYYLGRKKNQKCECSNGHC
jgi:hypothetical protein